jgi:hypothetical protein
MELAEVSDVETDYEFAQTEAESDGESSLTGDACDKIVNGVTVRLTTPECAKDEAKVPFESAMLGALNELGCKSNELAAALDMQFKKNAKLAASKVMSVSGSISLTPAADKTFVTPVVPTAPSASTISVSTSPAN